VDRTATNLDQIGTDNLRNRPVTAFDQPIRLVKGGDWPVSEIIGADLVQVSGGTVHTIPIRYPCSTSELLKKIRTTNS
jgi:bifunctional ADP-heptose synthase (sugar kinase/adenylyltransferase)